MKQISTLRKTILFCLTFLSGTMLFAQTTKYNVLFIALDDMNTRCSIFDYPGTVTPNLSRLVAKGTLFKRAYCQYPICNASRTSLLTGWRPDKTGVFSNGTRPSTVLPPDAKFLPDYFKENGYRTERYGKILHGDFENDINWDVSYPAGSSGGDRSLAAAAAIGNGEWWIDNVPDEQTGNGNIVRTLISSMQQSKSQPFFYGLGLTVHNPFTPSLKYWNMMGDPSVQELLPVDINGNTSNLKGNGSGNIALPATPAGDRNDVPSIAFPDPPVIKDNAEWRRQIHAYDAEVTQMDAQLGLVLDELDRQNLWANTVIVFWSDHGQHLGEHEGTWLKNTLFEESIQVPLIICAPAKPGNVISNRLVELVDIYPTLLQLCGLQSRQGLEGYSVAPLLTTPTQSWKRAVFTQVKRKGGDLMGHSVRTEQYHYNSWGTNGEELYDHNTDPLEYINLVNNSAYSTVLNDMRTILAEGWQQSLPSSPCTGTTASVTPTGNINLCNGSTLVLTASSSTGYTYQWLRNGNNIAGATSQTYTASQAGSFQVKISNTSGCSATSSATTISKLNAPDATITALSSLNICQAGSVVLRANNGTNLTYQWTRNGTNITGATNRKYTATTTGTYAVKVTSRNGCSKTSATVTVTNSCGAFAFTQESVTSQILVVPNMVSVYPNPSTDHLTVLYNSNSTGKVQLQVRDLTGRTVFTQAGIAVKGSNTYKLNLSNLSQGVYSLGLYNNNQQLHVKFVKGK